MIKRFFKNYFASYQGLPGKAWYLAMVLLVNRSGSMVLFFMSLYLTREMGFSVVTAGRVLSIYGVGSLIGSWLGGWLTDRWSNMHVQMMSLISSGFCFIIMGYCRSLTSISIMMLITAILTDMFRPANVAAFCEICTEKLRPRGFALMRLAVNAGLVIGPAAGGFLAVRSYLYIFWVDGLTCLGAALLMYLLFFKYHSSEAGPSADTNSSGGSPWQDTGYLYILGLVLFLGAVFFQILNTWPLYLRQHYFLQENQIGSLLAINALIILFVEMPLIHRLEDKNPLGIIRTGLIMMFVGFILLPLGSTYLFASVTVIIWTLGEIMIFPLLASAIANRTSDSNRGSYMGLYTFTFSLSMVISPVAGTWIYEHIGPDWLWGIVGITVFMIWGGFHYKRMIRLETG